MPSHLVRMQIVASAIGAVMIATHWVVRDTPSSLPPGVLIFGLAAAALIVVRRWVTVLLAVVAGGLITARLLDLGNLGLLLLTALLCALITVAAGVVELVRLHRRSRVDRAPDWRQNAQIAALLVLSPIWAEYLAAYDDSTGDPVALLAGLVIFIPLYGAPTLLIREIARRSQLGWTGIVLLAAAAALIQAGLVDQSLFSTDYRGIEGWEETYRATLIEPWGVSAFNLANFAGGHVVFSFCAPIALVEAMRPATASRPWLGSAGLGITAAAYLAAAGLVLHLHLTTEASHASGTQVLVSAGVVVALVSSARWLGRRAGSPVDGPAPTVPVVLALSLVPSALYAFAPETWVGVGMGVAATVLAAVGISVGARMRGWGVRHIAAVVITPLILRALTAFTYDPLVGEVAAPAKYAHNAAMLVIVVVAAVFALRTRQRPLAETGSRQEGRPDPVDQHRLSRRGER